jgi:hypothetical protein
MSQLPAARRIKLLRSRVLKMSVRPGTGEVDVLLRIAVTELEDRNAIHRAMKHGEDLALAYYQGKEVEIDGTVCRGIDD